jgi:hypothetical protein
MSLCALSDGPGNADGRLEPLRICSGRLTRFVCTLSTRLLSLVRAGGPWQVREGSPKPPVLGRRLEGPSVSTGSRPMRLKVIAWSRCARGSDTQEEAPVKTGVGDHRTSQTSIRRHPPVRSAMREFAVAPFQYRGLGMRPGPLPISTWTASYQPGLWPPDQGAGGNAPIDRNANISHLGAELRLVRPPTLEKLSRLSRDCLSLRNIDTCATHCFILSWTRCPER